MKLPKILFFILADSPTAEQRLEAARMPGQVCFRNANYINAEGALEDCAGVAGEVPARYQSLPSYREAIEAHFAKLEAEAAAIPVELPPADPGKSQQNGAGSTPPPLPQKQAAKTDASQGAAVGGAVGDWGGTPAK